MDDTLLSVIAVGGAVILGQWIAQHRKRKKAERDAIPLADREAYRAGQSLAELVRRKWR